MVYLDVLIQLYSCVQWHFYQTMIVARSSLSAKFPWSMVIYDTSEDIWKIFKIYGYFGNFEKFENFGKFWIFLKILEKNWKFWKKIENFRKKLKILEKNFQSRRQILTARGVYRLKILHCQFHLISSVLVIKTQKKWVKMEKFTPLAKILYCRRQWRHWQISTLPERR